MLNKLKEVETENANLVKQIEETKKDIEFAKSPEFAEKIAREKFDMIKDGELIIILESK
jgi:cell division protein FtsB